MRFNKKKVILYILGFVTGCALMLAAIIGLYMYTASKETAAVSTFPAGGNVTGMAWELEEW